VERGGGKRFKRQIDFIVEIDKLKSIQRHTLLMDSSRRENDAEHAWHLALTALVFSGLSKDKNIDLLRVIKMALIHDLVEIDSGDVFLYDEKERLRRARLERAAAKRIFGILPADQAGVLRSLWEEFEKRKTPEAKFAAALDRFQPVLHNYMTKGKTWKRHKVDAAMVLEKNAHIADGAPELWERVKWMVEEGVREGYFGKSAGPLLKA
jgi:putative hydrolase of HD superfamily